MVPAVLLLPTATPKLNAGWIRGRLFRSNELALARATKQIIKISSGCGAKRLSDSSALLSSLSGPDLREVLPLDFAGLGLISSQAWNLKGLNLDQISRYPVKSLCVG